MTAFSPTRLSNDFADKAFEYSAQILDEPFSDLFDQYLTHTISDIDDHGHASAELDFPDLFTDGDTTSSASYVTDSTSSASSQPRYDIAKNRAQEQHTTSLSKTAFLPQNYPKRARRERLQPAVSGLELLLDIEGKTDSKSIFSPPPHSAPSTLQTLPLRRKARFGKTESASLHDRDHRIAKRSSYSANDPPNMIRPLYNYRHESPQPQEWAHGVDRLSLHPQVGHDVLSPPDPTLSHHQGETDTGLEISRHMTLREQFLYGEQSSQQNLPCAQINGFLSFEANLEVLNQPLYDTTSMNITDDRYHALEDDVDNRQLGTALSHPQLREHSSWDPSDSNSDNANYTFSSNHADFGWIAAVPEDTACYYSNSFASKSAPALPYQPSRDEVEDSGREMEAPNTCIMENEGAPKYLTETASQSIDHLTPEEPLYPPITSSTQLIAPENPESPPRRASTPTTASSQSRDRRRSKSAQRRKSAGNLKTPKSPATMGFVNFTPSDSRRILTGVAPSGSSKTKARREQEANEKKRKLSLAVLKAVEEAGGDPEPLRKEGLFIDG
ncbi:MAG: hypothetical protein Q9222_004109 [Ikaeria aurantiellina]